MVYSEVLTQQDMIDDLSQHQLKILYYINMAGSVVSLCGSTFIVLCYLSFRNLRHFAFSLVFWLSIADIGNGTSNLMGGAKGGPRCLVQAILLQVFSVASFLWTTTIAFTLHRTVVMHKADVATFSATFHVYVWGTSIFLASVPLIGNHYGYSPVFCWVKSETLYGQILSILIFYGPLWCAILFNAVVYFRVIRRLRHTMKIKGWASSFSDKNQHDRLEIKVVKRLFFYPLILLVCWAWATANRIQNFVSPESPHFWLYVLHISFSSLQGFLNSLAYGLNAGVRQQVRSTVGRLFGSRPPDSDFSTVQGDEGEVADEDEQEEQEEPLSVDEESQPMSPYSRARVTGHQHSMMMMSSLRPGDSPDMERGRDTSQLASHNSRPPGLDHGHATRAKGRDVYTHLHEHVALGSEDSVDSDDMHQGGHEDAGDLGASAPGHVHVTAAPWGHAQSPREPRSNGV